MKLVIKERHDNSLHACTDYVGIVVVPTVQIFVVMILIISVLMMTGHDEINVRLINLHSRLCLVDCTKQQEYNS